MKKNSLFVLFMFLCSLTSFANNTLLGTESVTAQFNHFFDTYKEKGGIVTQEYQQTLKTFITVNYEALKENVHCVLPAPANFDTEATGTINILDLSLDFNDPNNADYASMLNEDLTQIHYLLNATTCPNIPINPTQSA